MDNLQLPARHPITTRNIKPAALKKVLLQTYERQAQDFEQLLGAPGIGPMALRSLSLIAEVTRLPLLTMFALTLTSRLRTSNRPVPFR